MLFLESGSITGVGCFVAPATRASPDHGERAPLAFGRTVGLGPVNHVAVMGQRVARFEQDRPLAAAVFVIVVGDALREAQYFGCLMRSHSQPMRAGNVTQAAVL